MSLFDWWKKPTPIDEVFAELKKQHDEMVRSLPPMPPMPQLPRTPSFTTSTMILNQPGEAMADEVIFTVLRAKNGFYARLKDGTIVVGTELSEVCIAASGAAAEQVIAGDDTDPSPASLWQKVK